MKFTLGPTGHSDDPFGFDAPVVVEIADRRSASDSGFRLAEQDFLPANPIELDSGDVFSAFGASSGKPAHSFPGFKLAKAEPRGGEYFGPASPGRGGAAVQLTPPEEDDSLFGTLGAEPARHDPDAHFTKSAEGEFNKSFGFAKVEEGADGNVMVWGIATHEKPDADNELCDYDAAKSAYQQWSLSAVQRTSGAGQEISLGPIRYQHSMEPAGKATKLTYDDDAKEIWLGSVPISDDVRKQLQGGFLTGYSQGGSYAWRKCAHCDKSLSLQQGNNFCANCKAQVPVRFGLKRLAEVSYVDSPATGKGFEYVKSDGSSRFVTFARKANPAADGVRVLSTEIIYERGTFQLVKSTVEVAGRQRTAVHCPGVAVLI